MTLAPQLNYMPVEPLAIALFALANELEKAYPGLAEQHGWVRVADAAALASALTAASGVTRPEGLQ